MKIIFVSTKKKNAPKIVYNPIHDKIVVSTGFYFVFYYPSNHFQDVLLSADSSLVQHYIYLMLETIKCKPQS